MSPNTNPERVEVLKPIRRSVIVLAIRIFLVLFLVDTGYALLLLASALGYVPLEGVALYAVFLWVVYTLKYILLTYLLIKLVVDWISTLYCVTGGHLLRQRGVLRTTETIFQLADIDSVVMSQSWLGKIFNFGDVTIEFTVARQKEFVVLYAIDSPGKYEELFLQFV